MATKKPKAEIASYLRKSHAFQALTRDLASSEKTVSRVRTLYPDTDPGEVLRVMREEYAALEKELKEERPIISLRRAGEYQKLEARPFVVRKDIIEVYQSDLVRFFDKLTPRCPDLTIGRVQASGFQHYHWAGPYEDSSWDFFAFWPYGQYPNQLPDATFSGDWSGEIGAWFVGWLEVYPKRFWWDPFDLIAHAGVLQFTLPAPDCDSIVYWGTLGHAVATADWIVTADSGDAWTEWVLHQSPEGAGFPASIYDFEFFHDGLGKSHTGESKTSDDEAFNRSFRVKAGVKSRIYLGLSALLEGRNGRIEVPGLGSYFKFDYGITFSIVPDVGQPM